MKLEFVTLTGIQLDQEVYEVTIPTASGIIGVFPGHEPLVSIAVPGVITVRYKKGDAEDKLDYFAIGGGVVDITQTTVRVLVDEADRGEDIIESEAKAALDNAVKLRDNAKDQVELEKASQLVDRHVVQLKVADLRRRHRRN